MLCYVLLLRLGPSYLKMRPQNTLVNASFGKIYYHGWVFKLVAPFRGLDVTFRIS